MRCTGRLQPPRWAIRGKCLCVRRLPAQVSFGVVSAPSTKANTSGTGTDIFIIHGHNGELKETVARFIEKLGLKAVILHEQPNQGRTIIEKLEHNSDFTSFAIAIFTSDDVGATKNNPHDLKPRARQNVVLEFGYFMGKLGRARGCAIVQEDIELPSDNAGIAYIPYDANGAWRVELSRELKAAGFAVDMNLVY